jgi:TonB-linked SusC/RagA family outer membrane protein
MRPLVNKMMRVASCYCLIGVFLLQFGNPSNVRAQLIASTSSSIQANSYYPVNIYKNSIPELQRVISIDKDQEQLKDVLKEIASKTDLGIAYNSDLEILNKRVSVKLLNTKAADILEYIFLGSDYEAAISSTREILLIKREKAEAKQNIEIEISGVVRDAGTGETLPTVSVFVKGTNIGVTSNMDGEFELTVPDDSEILVFRFVGYKEIELPITGNMTNLEIEMEEDLLIFEDVVVVGYGTQQREEVTGSVSSIRTEELENIPVSSFENALQGRLAGVNVVEPTGEPGASPEITIRGGGSITASNGPLYVIDGVPLSRNSDLQVDIQSQRASFQAPKSNAFSSLNPNDIESIDVLKDAASAAIYGSRGAGGVILVTTKKGDPGINRVTVSMYGGASSVVNKPDLMNAEELIAYTKDARNNNYLQDIENGDAAANPSYNPDNNAGRPNVANYLIPEQYVNWNGTDTDWLDVVLSSSAQQNYHVSASGGTEKASYFLSAGYLDQEGIIDGSSFNRYNFRANITYDINDRISVGSVTNAALTKHDRLPANAPYFGQPPGIIYSALVHSPVVSPYNPDGTINQLNNQSYLGGGTTTASNPLAIQKFITEEINNNRLFGSLYGTVDITDKITFKSLIGYDVDDYQSSFYRGTQFLYRNQTSPQPFAQSSGANGFNWLWENTVNYQETFNEDHKVGVLVGYTAQKQKNEVNLVTANGFVDDQVPNVAGGIVTGGGVSESEWALASALARVNYSYQSKYLAALTVRSDRASRFGQDNQTGIFPSFSLGWRVAEESFMESLDVFNELKLRASYGVAGNFEIGNYSAISLLGSVNYTEDGSVFPGSSLSTLGDSELTWETSYQTNIGVDYAMLNDRIYGSIDYYNTTTKDLLLSVNVPPSTGFSSVLTNIGEVENKGFEFSITSRNLVGDFQWATDFNFSTNDNKVTKLGPNGDPILVPGAAGVRHITQIGSTVGSYYGYVVDRVYQNQAEIDADNSSAPGGDYDLLAPDPAPGDFRFKDVNGDGVVNSDDRTTLGSYQPDFIYGISNRFNYKNFDLRIFIQGVVGREVLNLTSRHLLNGEANFNSYAALNDRWISESEPGNGEHPRADRNSNAHGNNNRVSSYQVQDGSYISIKNVQFGYNLPVNKLGNFAKKARIYASATNLAIFTDYIGFNPEVNLQASNSLTPGEDYGAYPLARTIQLGINLEF